MKRNLFDTLKEVQLILSPLSKVKKANVVDALLFYAESGIMQDLKKDEQVAFTIIAKWIEEEWEAKELKRRRMRNTVMKRYENRK